MTVIAIIPALIALLGFVVWFVATNAKVSEAGRLAFFAGLFVTLLVFATHVVRLS